MHVIQSLSIQDDEWRKPDGPPVYWRLLTHETDTPDGIVQDVRLYQPGGKGILRDDEAREEWKHLAKWGAVIDHRITAPDHTPLEGGFRPGPRKVVKLKPRGERRLR